MQQTSHTSTWASGDIAEAITHLEQQWAAAAKANDSGQVESFLHEIFVEMDSDGAIYKRAEVLNRVKADRWQAFEVSDVKVVVLGGTIAIATGAWHGQGTLPDGKAIDAREHWLDTWHKNGSWKCLASASTPVKDV